MKYIAKRSAVVAIVIALLLPPSHRKRSLDSAGSSTTQPTTPMQSCVTSNLSSSLPNSGKRTNRS